GTRSARRGSDTPSSWRPSVEAHRAICRTWNRPLRSSPDDLLAINLVTAPVASWLATAHADERCGNRKRRVTYPGQRSPSACAVDFSSTTAFSIGAAESLANRLCSRRVNG